MKNENNLRFCEIRYGSIEYREALSLRDKYLRKPLGLSFLKEELENDKTAFHLIGREGTELFGCLVLMPLSKTCVRLQQCVVGASSRGKGYGKKLVQFAEAFSCKKKNTRSRCTHVLQQLAFIKS